MFNNNSGREDIQAKKEEDNHDQLIPKYTSTSRQWAGFKNPRIVRVSKAFGGKDRHSKVCTVKGLRDRRIRLSVPTALQLYDLQDKLGVNQPSKVIDWLLDSTKDDIDQLPPLQMLFGDYNQLPPPTLISQDLNSPHLSFSQFLRNPNATFVKDVGNQTLLYKNEGVKIENNLGINGDHQRKKGKEAIVEKKWYEHQNGDDENKGLNFFPIPQYSNYQGLYPYNPYNPNWETCSNVSISQFGNQGLVSSQNDSSMGSASQLIWGHLNAITPSTFPPFIMPNLGENHDLVRQNNYFHLLSSSSQHVPPNSLMPLFNPSDSDAHLKASSQNNDG